MLSASCHLCDGCREVAHRKDWASSGAPPQRSRPGPPARKPLLGQRVGGEVDVLRDQVEGAAGHMVARERRHHHVVERTVQTALSRRRGLRTPVDNRTAPQLVRLQDQPDDLVGIGAREVGRVDSESHAPTVGASNTALTSAAKPASSGDAAVSPRRYTPCSVYPVSCSVRTRIVSSRGSAIQYSGMPASA